MNTTKILTAGLFVAVSLSANAQNYTIVDTEQSKFFDDKEVIAAPAKGEPFYGQDAHHMGNAASYTDNGDGTITDNVTGLMWQKGFDVMSYPEAMKVIEEFKLAGHNDWRIPTIKEAYSLILFSGSDVNPQLNAGSDSPGSPFINTNFFEFEYGANGNRPIDSQLLTSSLYVGSTEQNNLLFGVNFADGRIKGYGLKFGNGDKPFMVRFVRGEQYGINDFGDNGDGTITDNATKLVWSKEDSQRAMNWGEALAYAEQMNAQGYLGHSDWRVPNAKELQSIVDYSRSPLSSASAAIDPIFAVSEIVDEAGEKDFPFYWSSTTHENSGTTAGSAGIYVAFGRSLGNMSNMQMMPTPQGEGGNGPQMGNRPPQEAGQGRPEGGRPEGGRPEGDRPEGGRPEGQGNHQQPSQNAEPNWVDVHGAGSQRSDPKSGDPSIYADGHGPQGDVVRTYNYVRLVRDL
ncbi:MAG: DUF1566 domain-containing protein [Rikenellaceae bacterium]